jgi:hypothetical protein
MKHLIKKILKEEQLEFNLFNDDTHKYESCSYFANEDEKELCLKLESLRSFLFEDGGIGLKKIINSKLEKMMKLMDVNQNYQRPLKILYDTKKYNTPNSYDYIDKKGDYYENNIMKTVNRVLDKDGKYDYINKLNTNYSDLAELLTELFIRGGMVQKLNTKNVIGLKKYLSSIKDKLERVLDKYIKIGEYNSFVRNTKYRSGVGEKAENEVKNILEKSGMVELYQGGDGDFIDMVFGIDLIMDDNGKTVIIQVKSKENQAKSDLSKRQYKKVDFLVAPTDYGIIMFDHKGGEIRIDKNGNKIS